MSPTATVLRVSVAHLSGQTLRNVEGWTQHTAPVPLFARHAQGFICVTEIDPAGDAPLPGDLAAAMKYAARSGASYIDFNLDGPVLSCLPDLGHTHGEPLARLLSDAEADLIAQNA